MANVIIETEDGANYSVDEAQFKRHYPDRKYKVLGAETDGSFALAGIPRQKRTRSKPKAKGTAPKATPIASEPETAGGEPG